jgi:large subunit ribosomal protein L25
MKLEVSERKDESTKKLRRDGVIPCVYYHKGEESVKLSVKVDDLKRVLGSKEPVVTFSNGKQSVVKEVQRDPVSRALFHVSFEGVVAGETLHQEVDVVLKSDEKCGWKTEKLTLVQVLKKVTVETTPDKLPDSITVDVSGLTLHNGVKVADLKVVEGVKVTNDPTQEVAHVVVPKAVVEEVVVTETVEEENKESDGE